MLEAHSPLGAGAVFELGGLLLREEPFSRLTLVAGTDKALKKVLGKLPSSVGSVTGSGETTLFRVGPQQVWVIGSEVPAGDGICVTPLSASRTRILVQGPTAAELLASCAAIDFDSKSTPTGQFVMTGIHHTPVLIHRVDAVGFHVYVLRTFALDVWEWLADAAAGLAETHA
jgi:methylglutamate dehydrogenase subunit D